MVGSRGTSASVLNLLKEECLRALKLLLASERNTVRMWDGNIPALLLHGSSMLEASRSWPLLLVKCWISDIT